VNEASVQIDLTVSPPGLLYSYQTPVFTDASGRATSELIAGDRHGLVCIDAIAVYPAQRVTLSIDPKLVSLDELAPESDPLHNSHPEADLTAMYAWLDSDTLTVSLDFTSLWDYVLLMVVLETNGDAAGASQDAFEQPIFYMHTLRPDYVFTTKYSAENYADLRRWNSGTASYEFWTGGGWGDGGNAMGMTSKTPFTVTFGFPLAAIGQVNEGDTVRMEAYVSQEFSTGEKFNALDSTPHDATHDMLPETGEWWETATRPVSLTNYATHVFPVGGTPPLLSEAEAAPVAAGAGESVRLSVGVTDGSGGIGDVFADLSQVGGSRFTVLRDDGSGGDDTPADGVYSADFVVPPNALRGDYLVVFTGRDSLNIAESKANTLLSITTVPVVIKSVIDPTGDDHGPSIPLSGLYYYYPGNAVFAPGAFDIERVELLFDGADLIIRTHIGNLPTSEAVGWGAPFPGASCTNPNKAELNLQKIDVYIDAQEWTGATTGLPYRYISIADRDAWEFAIAIEGWYMALIESHGEDSPSSWTLSKHTSVIDVCNDHVEDYVDIRIARSALGDPSADEIRTWDFIITMASHDGDSNNQNFGGIRWVNGYTSEWQFGNGRNAEAGREMDANIVDVATIVGEGKRPGTTQQEMLNYLLPDAVERFNNWQMACLLEATHHRNWVVTETKMAEPGDPRKTEHENRAFVVESGLGSAEKLFRFHLADRCHTELSIHDVHGRRVRMLTSGVLPKGDCSLSWDGCGDDGDRLSPGIYFLRLQVGSRALSRKIVVVR